MEKEETKPEGGVVEEGERGGEGRKIEGEGD